MCHSQDESLDTLFSGALRLKQSLKGHRFNLDTLLLAGALRIGTGARVLDLGSGNGILPLAICHLHHPAQVVGLELQPQLVKLAQENVLLNELQERVEIRQGDVREAKTRLEAASYDAVVFNPPYYPARAGRINPNPEKAISRHELHGTLEDFLVAAQHALSNRGRLLIVLPSFRLGELILGLRRLRLREAWIQAVHPTSDKQATHVLLEARKGGAPSLLLRPPLVIRTLDRYTETIQTLLEGNVPRLPGEAS